MTDPAQPPNGPQKPARTPDEGAGTDPGAGPALTPSPLPPLTPSGVEGPPRQPGQRALALLESVRAHERRTRLLVGAALGLSTLLVAFPAAALLATKQLAAGRTVLALGVFAALALFLVFAVLRARRAVGDVARTARSLAGIAPGVTLDLLAAVELSRALGERHDFSPDLARAFLVQVDAQAQQLPLARLVDDRPRRRALAALAVAGLAATATLALRGAAVREGLARLVAPTIAAPLARTPITGDFAITYRYPAYTGLEARTVAGGDGAVQGLAGTEVHLETHADRDVDAAALVVNGAKVPLAVRGRALAGDFVLESSGQYHVVFLDGARAVAEGPDLPLTVELDQAPTVTLRAPADKLELAPDGRRLQLVYEASDDFGLTALELVYRAPGAGEKRLPLRPDEGRTTRGRYDWDLSSVLQEPGQVVTYWLEAKDGDAVKGPKRGASRTQSVSLYSAAEHRRAALEKTEKLWERLVTHLADRLEGPDRALPLSDRSFTAAAKDVDAKETQLAADFTALAQELDRERDPPGDVVEAAHNVGAELLRDAAQVSSARRLAERTAQGPTRPLGPRVLSAVATDIGHAENAVLYLEQLLDRQRLLALKELAQQLRQDRKELSALLEDYAKTKDEQAREALLQQVENLRQRMMELQRRMAELSKGIREEHMNREALQEMMQEEDLGSRLDEMEKLVREGKADEALKKMQELAMQMDEFLEKLDQAEDKADEDADPELSKMVDEFQQGLEDTTAKQEALAKDTRQLRDKYRAEAKQRIAQQGQALKAELGQKLAELKKDYQASKPESLGSHGDELQQRALQQLEFTQKALESDDFDLASESADKLAEKAAALSQSAEEQQRMDEVFNASPKARQETKQRAATLEKDAKKADEVARKLKNLFPRGEQMTPEDQQRAQQLQREQKQLEQQAGELGKKAEELSQRAPILDEDAKRMLDQAEQRMGNAAQRLGGKDPGRAAGEQQGAIESLQGLKQQLQQQAGQGQGGKRGLPRPFRARGGRSRGTESTEKVEIPEEDPNQAPREFRKDVMDAMKQGAPDKYRDQNKRYYEELVK